jgi:hypothetical protein
MLPQALGSHEYHSKFMTDIPWILLLSLALAILCPSCPAASIDKASRLVKCIDPWPNFKDKQFGDGIVDALWKDCAACSKRRHD